MKVISLGHCRRWRSLLQLPAGLDGLIDENCSRLALDVLVASHHSWVWIHSSSLSCEFQPGECRLYSVLLTCVGCRCHCWSNMVREGCISNHAKSTQEFHPPLKLRQPMKAHFNGKGRPNDFFSPRRPFRFGPWPSEVFLFPRFQRMMKPRLFIFIPDEYNTFHDFLLHPLKWVKLMITETDDRPKDWK